ncbi:hypothetical protein [Peribacillus frigoritolerans]|uniref:Uncharacterized protein n=1 Tax=Peribacillus frigoritolerans TaxID=450367 RepID=A0AAJ1QKH0_9BACI|nr:hypothetical protein [Peribacillus frigoritolerans]MDM5283113.1 hypothetical protein [Peribacillus frigoritolerans]
MRMSDSYFLNVCTTNGVSIVGLGRQDIEVKALRSLSYSGTINDMRRAFYFDRTGIPFLADAINANTNTEQ